MISRLNGGFLMALVVAARTDKGRVRSNNEDAFYIDGAEGLFIVADGLGGHAAGEVASLVAVEEIVRFTGDPVMKSLDGEDLLRKAVEAANKEVFVESRRNPGRKGMGTTVVVAMVRKDVLWLAHVGDSRAYFKPQGTLQQLTDDHTMTNEVGHGHLSAAHLTRGYLSRAVGTQANVEVDTREVAYGGGTLLLCTDGLTNMLAVQEIEHILEIYPDPQESCDILIDSANLKGGIDNITVIVVMKTDGPGKDSHALSH
jgi:protein phosphatase